MQLLLVWFPTVSSTCKGWLRRPAAVAAAAAADASTGPAAASPAAAVAAGMALGCAEPRCPPGLPLLPCCWSTCRALTAVRCCTRLLPAGGTSSAAWRPCCQPGGCNCCCCCHCCADCMLLPEVAWMRAHIAIASRLLAARGSGPAAAAAAGVPAEEPCWKAPCTSA